MKKIAVRAIIVLAVVVALCMFFSGTVRTITTAKVRFTNARQGKFEMVSELTGQVHFKDTEELKLDVPEGAAVEVTRVFVKPGQEIKAGDQLISAKVVDYDKTMAALQKDYDTSEATLRNLVRQNGEVRLTRNEKAWMEAYYAAQAASQTLRDCRVEVQTLLSIEQLELPEKGVYPEEASDELIAAIDARNAAEQAAEEANAALDSLNRYAIDETTWTYITQRKDCEEKMESSEADMTALALLAHRVELVCAAHDGYVAEVPVEKGAACDGTTVLMKLTEEGSSPVIRTDITDIKQTVAAGSVVAMDGSRYGRVESAVVDTGVNADGTRYADVAITEDVIWACGSVSTLMQSDVALKLTTRSQEATCLLSPAAVRGSDGDRYVLVAVRESSTFGGTQMKAQKQSVTVLNESDTVVSVAEDLSRAQIIYMEDRAVNEGDAVMEYGG